jgi:hypothetical protein
MIINASGNDAKARTAHLAQNRNKSAASKAAVPISKILADLTFVQ